MSNAMSIGELSDRVGLTRRAVRFYVQRGMIPPPEGKGRGSRYGKEHLAQIEKIQNFQKAGHSLEAIRRILDGEQGVEVPPTRRPKSMLKVDLWTRLRVAEGVELHFDTSKHQPSPQTLEILRNNLLEVFTLR